MPGRHLVDTSILVALLRGDASVAQRLADAEEGFTSVVVLGELEWSRRARSSTA